MRKQLKMGAALKIDMQSRGRGEIQIHQLVFKGHFVVVLVNSQTGFKGKLLKGKEIREPELETGELYQILEIVYMFFIDYGANHKIHVRQE